MTGRLLFRIDFVGIFSGCSALPSGLGDFTFLGADGTRLINLNQDGKRKYINL